MKSKKNIYLMYAIALLQGMVFYGSIATLYRQANGITVFQITLIESISYILCIALEIPWGIVADKIGYKKTLCFCCTLYFVSKLVFWQADGFLDFLVERIMLSVVVAGMSGVDTSILYLSCEEGESQKVFGIYNSLGTVGLLSSALVFSALVGNNYRMAAFLTVISYGVAAILSLLLTEVKEKSPKRASLSQFKEIFFGVLRNKKLIMLLVSVAFITQTHQTITVFLNQVKYENCGLSDSNIGYIYIAITLIGLLGIFSSKLTRKLGVKLTGALLYLTIILSCVMLGLTNVAVLSVLGVLLINVANGLFQPLQMERQNKQVVSSNRATELSIYAMIIDGVGAGTSVMFGALTKISLSAAFFGGAMLCLFGVVLFCIQFNNTKKM